VIATLIFAWVCTLLSYRAGMRDDDFGRVLFALTGLVFAIASVVLGVVAL
jgi:hypothetical protein